jgi:hypothetical protein
MVVDDLDRGPADIYRLAVRYEGEDSARKQVQSDYSHQQRTSLLVTIDKVFTHGLKQDAGE